MGTTVEFNVPVERNEIRGAARVCDMAESRISELDNMLSIFNDSSAVSEINKDNTKQIITVNPELFLLIKRAKEYYMLTQGAFDITVAPLTEEYGFGENVKGPPDSQAISNILGYIGLDKIELNEEKGALIFKDPRVQIDFGGLAKGYAVDEATKIFKANNIKNALINIGGDLYCLGSNLGGEKYSIGIKNPDDKEEIMAILRITDRAVATSGSYENFFVYNDEMYSHIIDPRSGYPASNNLRSVTIIADDCTTADAIATAVFVLGEDKGLALIGKLSNTECLLVVNRGGKSDIVLSSGMERYIEERL
jgi:thiamine biosynthesis lipoprotein